MADPKWQRHLNPVMSRAVPLTSNLLGGKLLDKLLEAECLTSHQYDEIVRLKDKDGPDDVSRKLLMMLRRKPSPSFDTFCKVLRDPEVEEGMNLYKCLMGISPAEPAPASSQEQLASDVRRKRFRAYHESTEFPEKVLHIVCQSAINETALKSALGVSNGDMSMRHRADTPYEKIHSILEVWIARNGSDATLELLFDAVKQTNCFGTVEQEIRALPEMR
eukprot:m.34770 g.34770  ORF g.34770 m.34770 type:complete len:219 (+) comp32012_c0_seq2:366-1022(+)